MAYFAVLYTYDERSAERDTLRPAHRDFLRDLLGQDVVLAAGAYTDDAEPGALLLIQADSDAAVSALLARDPFVIAGLVPQIQVRAWSAAIGPWAV